MKSKKSKMSRRELETSIRELQKELHKVKLDLLSLSCCHEIQSRYKHFNNTFGEITRTIYSHKGNKAITEMAGEVTFDDLALFVIDGKPIEVTETIKQTRKILPKCVSFEDVNQETSDVQQAH